MPEQSLGQGQTTYKAKTPLHIKTMLYLSDSSDSESTAFLFVTNCRIIGLYSRCGETRPNTGSRRVKRKEKRMFREIRRKNREIDSDSAKQLLQSSRRGVLAVNGEAQRIYFHGAKIGHKVDALRACDKVCFTVYGNETIKTDAWAPFMQSVVVFGRCHLIEAGPEATRRIKQLAMKYHPSEQLIDEEIAQSGKAVQVFEIKIEHMSGKEVQER